MSILINKDTRIVTQGITGKTGEFHTTQCLDYAFGRDCFVAGVTPGKEGQSVQGVPVYNTVADAKSHPIIDRSTGLRAQSLEEVLWRWRRRKTERPIQ